MKIRSKEKGKKKRMRNLPAGELEDADSFGLRVIGATKNSKNSTHDFSFL